jgi:predicted alpha/beta hydrolase family esterase
MLKINFILNQQANDPKVPANKKRICPLADLLEDDEMIKNLAKAKSVERKDDGMFDGSSTASVGSQLDEILLEIKANGHISHYQFAEGWGHGIHLD